MIMRKARAILVGVLSGLVVSAAAQQSTTQSHGLSYYERAEVQYAVYGILRAADRGDWATLWKKTSPIGRQRLSESAWSRVLSDMRHTVGDYENRNEIAMGTADEITDGTKCRCAVFEFHANFSKLAADEKVIVSFEDGEWKLAGYFLKPSGSR